MSSVRKYFSGIRGRFLLYFLIGMLITLVCANVVNYFTVGEVLTSMNDSISRLEFSQVKSSINALLDFLDKSGADLLYSTAMLNLANRVNQRDYASAAHHVNQLKDEVIQVMQAEPAIESIYFFIGDGFILETSGVYTTLVIGAGDAGMPSERVLDAVAGSGRSLTALGGLSSLDLPLHLKTTAVKTDAPLLMLYKSVYYKRTRVTIGINIYESAVASQYEGIMQGTGRSLRVISPDAVIVSSSNKQELGQPFPSADMLGLQTDGEATRDRVRLSWRTLYQGQLIAVNEVPMATLLQTVQPIQQRVTLVFVLLMTLTGTLFFLWLRRVISPLGRLVRGMQSAGQGNYEDKLSVRGNDEFSLLSTQFNSMMDALKAFTERQRLAEKMMRGAELQALRNQINPHFLYNTLNSIRWMAVLSGADNIERCIIALGDILMPLYKNNQPDCALEDELRLIKSYLEIMNTRYDHRIAYVEDVPDALRGARLPRLTLQPLCENAIIHGIAPTGRRGTVTLSASEADGVLSLSVADDGVGLSQEELSLQNARLLDERNTESVGMPNVCLRVRLLYGEDTFGVTLSHNSPSGIRATLRLPIQR